MKKRILPIGFISLLISGLAAFSLIFANFNNSDGEKGMVRDNRGSQSIIKAKEYLAKIRNNQHTGLLDPRDEIKARQQIEAQANYKSGAAIDLDWIEMGPDNIGGRTRALIFDNRDQNGNTIYAASVTGGIFKTTNLGTVWNKINLSNGTANLNVSCMVQTDDGTIYAGTGEGFNTQDYTALGNMGYEGGFIGRGIFKSDGNDNFTLVNGTQPTTHGDTTEWAYINEIALDTKNNRLFAATDNSLKYADFPDLNNWQSDCKHSLDSIIFTRDLEIDSIITCDSFYYQNGHLVIVNPISYNIDTTKNDTTNTDLDRKYIPFEEYGNCFDVKVSPDGWIITEFNNLIYVSESGNTNEFVNRSIYPDNPDAFGKDSLNFTINIKLLDTLGTVLYDSIYNDTETGDWAIVVTNDNGYPSNEDIGRVEFAIAPSDPNIVYAMAAKSSIQNQNSLQNIYLSEDKGQTWRVVAPGGSESLNILGSVWFDNSGNDHTFYQGDYNNTIAVFPNDPYRILAGGVNLWEGTKIIQTGYYQWSEKSIGNTIFLPLGIYDERYCHVNHHAYVFQPGNNNKFIIGTDGGLHIGNISGNTYTFQPLNKNYNTTQFYALDFSNEVDEVVGGAQDNGTLYISGEGNSPMNAEDIWNYGNPAYPEGSDGGYCAISNIRIDMPGISTIDPPVFYSKSPLPEQEDLVDRMRRSETLGFDYSSNFLDDDIINSNFLTPMILWESFDNQNSRDSVNFVADTNYNAGDNVMVRSSTYDYPFDYELPVSLNKGDSLRVKDIISNKLFIATTNEIWMTKEPLDFALTPEWFLISDNLHIGFEGNPQCMAYSSDANYLFVGTQEGTLFRISNIALAYDYDRADVNSPNCIIATIELQITEDNTQVITSISVDPKDANKVLVTLGNYGNTDYVYYTNNALSDNPEFNSVQGTLPQMPVYSSVLEMNESTNVAIIGTEKGIWISEDVASGEWYKASAGIFEVPVMYLKQQTVYKGRFTITYYDPATGDPFYEIFPEIKNYGMIYSATYGRGTFRNEYFHILGEEEHTFVSSEKQGLTIFPNPVVHSGNVSCYLYQAGNAQINIFDMQGRIVKTVNYNKLQTGNNTLKFDVETLNKGTYILQLVAGSKSSTSKFVIIK